MEKPTANTYRITLEAWLPLALVITLLCGLLYWAVQQSYRQSANDPQTQISEDTANIIATSGNKEGIVPTEQVDLRQSSGLVIMTFDDQGTLSQSTALLDGKPPVPPPGVFDYAKAHGQNRFSWQPATGVREAAVLQHYNGSKPGFVLVARSLKETEDREAKLMIGVVAGWLLTLTLSLLTIYCLKKFL